jgi:hypothetical protein
LSYQFRGGLNLARESGISDNEKVEGWSATMTEGNRQQSTKTARTQPNEELSSDIRSSMSPIENGTARVSRDETEPIDDQGTSQEEAAEILQILRDEAFEVKAWFSGNEPVDADVLLKARGIAMERGVDVDLPDQQEA